MKNQFEKLNKQERLLLFSAPALVSVLAASEGNKISKPDKADAIYLAHLKTFTAAFLLLPYYDEVYKNFKLNFNNIVDKYSPLNNLSREKLREEINTANIVIDKLDKTFALALHKSLQDYEQHVKHADMGLVDFIIPVPVPGITD
ncbi:hypothetical protein [Mucilaginibacter gilvus]|uniref:Uncharacterized protein n=1 Tax=Mucilaginibacter gilvus TaxID=2305909 RepID=A0A444MRZ3_9SPHI|nr:hypothetical protein [Mucilaginibacter gilvus]RWY55414.1 hypothetical protein EPL05_03305 [Mucilaginibacter gilvus]